MAGFFESGEELATEDSGQDLDGEEEPLATFNPRPSIGREATSGDNAVEMGMEEDVLAPGVKNRSEADLRAEMALVPCDFQESPGGGREEAVEEKTLVAQDEGVEFFGQSEDHVEVRDGKQTLQAGFQPIGTSKALALGAVTISA